MGLNFSDSSLVFLHGFCESAELWEGLLSNLSLTNDHIVPNMPGFGNETLPPGLKGLSDIAEKIEKQLPEARKYTLVGHSLGGYVALEMLRRRKREITSLCLFHSTARADSAEKKVNRNRTIEFLNEYGKEPFLKQFVPSLFYEDNIESQFGNIEKMRRIASKSRLEAIISYTGWMRDRRDQVELLQNANIPVLYIAGEYDEFLSLGSMEAEAGSIKSAELTRIDGAGHLGMIERPVVSASILREFLST